MGKKGKGRQSGGFASKSLQAHHHQEVSRLQDETLKWTRKETAGFVAWSNAHQKQQRRLAGERPRFALALRKNLNGILHERQALRTHLFRERRRRNGFLPRDNGHHHHHHDGPHGGWGIDPEHDERVQKGRVHPSGWLLRYDENENYNENDSDNGNNDAFDRRGNARGIHGMKGYGDGKPRSVPRLQTLALTVFAHYIREYRSAMGDEELYGALSILPPESITELSILLSSESNSSTTINTNTVEHTAARGRDGRRRKNQKDVDAPPTLYMDDDLAMLLGQHQHVERLCFRSRRSATTGRSTLTNAGFEALIPRNPMWLPKRHTRRRRKEENIQQDEGKSCGSSDGSSSSSSGATEGVPDCWEDDSESSEEENDYTDEVLDLEKGDDVSRPESRMIAGSSGCNLRLRRLELLDLTCSDSAMDLFVDDRGHGSTTSTLLRWFESCSGITHLSLAGSFRVHHEARRAILLSLPDVLPSLQVLDVTRCPWATHSLLARTMSGYFQNRNKPVGSAGNGEDNDENEDVLDRHSRLSSSQELLPTVYYYRGRFEWLPESMHNAGELDLWDE